MTTTTYILYVEFTDHANREIWAFETLERAEDFLRGFAGDFLLAHPTVDNPLEELPHDGALVAEFNRANAYPRIYVCEVGGYSGEEITPFAQAPRNGVTQQQ